MCRIQQIPWGSGLHPKGHSASLPFPWAHSPFHAVPRVEEPAQLTWRLAACPSLPATRSPQPTLSSGLGQSGSLWTVCLLITKAGSIHIPLPYASEAGRSRHCLLTCLTSSEERKTGYKPSLPDLKLCSSKPRRGERHSVGPTCYPPPLLASLLQTGKGCITSRWVLITATEAVLREDNQREEQKGGQHRKWGSALTSLSFSPSLSEGFGFLRNCQHRNQPINRQPQITGRGEGRCLTN